MLSDDCKKLLMLVGPVARILPPKHCADLLPSFSSNPAPKLDKLLLSLYPLTIPTITAI